MRTARVSRSESTPPARPAGSADTALWVIKRTAATAPTIAHDLIARPPGFPRLFVHAETEGEFTQAWLILRCDEGLMGEPSEVTQLLQQWSAGRQEALDRLL